jgi:hypothetical protein
MTERENGTEGLRVSDEDRARMARLRDEVMERVAEMSQVIEQTIAQAADENITVQLSFRVEESLNTVARFGEGEQEGEVRWALELPGSVGKCVVYQDPPGWCTPCWPLPN